MIKKVWAETWAVLKKYILCMQKVWPGMQYFYTKSYYMNLLYYRPNKNVTVGQGNVFTEKESSPEHVVKYDLPICSDARP